MFCGETRNALARRMVRCATLSVLLGGAAGSDAGAATIVDNSGSARNGKVGAYSAVVAQNGEVGISYYCEQDLNNPTPDAYSLRFAWNTGGDWQWITVGPGGSYTSMARDAQGVYHILYESGLGVTWASGAGPSWSISGVRVDTAAMPGEVSMVLDAAGRPHVAYMDAGGVRSLRYTRWSGSAWLRGSAELVAPGIWTPTISASNSYLALDSAGAPHIAYARPTDGVNAVGELQYASLQGDVWTSQSVGAIGANPSLAIGANDVPHMAFEAGDAVLYAFRSGGAWQFETVATGVTGISNIRSVSLALGPAGQPFVTFGMSTAEDLFLATRDASGWVVSRLDGDGAPSGAEILGRYGTSIDIDESGAPHISYMAIEIYDVPGGWTDFRADLRYAGSGGTTPVGPTITEQPTPAAVCVGGTATFSVSATGTGLLSYLWHRNGVPVSDGPTEGGSLIAGATTPTLVVSAASAFDIAAYACLITDETGTRMSSAAWLSVGAGPTITQSPMAAAICNNGAAAFSVSAAGVGSLGYQWRLNGVALTDGPTPSGAVISGASSDVLTIVGAGVADAGWLDCRVADDCGEALSDAAELRITPCGVLGDMNCDGSIDFFDIDPFLLALFDESGYEDAFPDCDLSNADINDDGAVDFFDIDPFLMCLFATCP